ncbi:recombinase [Streptococcus iniae]|uniref:Recombinase n=1 Tax=Streptococcus iniae TaxID=1346 RepID=A0A1J0MWK7_STRIN|nr:hypothetical protein K710_0010 [Streptococcus iniae SF1]AJG25086.1 recombinase [Streptococcus iniae]ESR10265.1 hypothetical protein IUSA1_02405 [Streptococcus iniae IUSA1]APD30988.1 recombinase [Streptococcus iniae]ASL33909.1 hypothetical protein QMA0248_0010 [Streptococcus iniae]
MMEDIIQKVELFLAHSDDKLEELQEKNQLIKEDFQRKD